MLNNIYQQYNGVANNTPPISFILKNNDW